MTGCNQDFQMLAVLSGADQLTAAEQASLTAHAASCSDCRKTIAGMSALAPHLTLATHTPPKVPRGFQARFIARATQEGVPLRAHSRALPSYALPLTSLAVLLLCVVGRSWTTRSSITPVSQVQEATTPEVATAELPLQPTPLHNPAHPVHRTKPAALRTPRVLNASAHFAWPQIATEAAFNRQPVFSRDLRLPYAAPASLVTKATLLPTVLKQDGVLNRLNEAPFAINMATLILREPPKIHLGEVAISDLTFIPNTSSHP